MGTEEKVGLYLQRVSTLCQADANEVHKSCKVSFQVTVRSVIVAFCSPQLLRRFCSHPLIFFIKVYSEKCRALVLAVLD